MLFVSLNQTMQFLVLSKKYITSSIITMVTLKLSKTYKRTMTCIKTSQFYYRQYKRVTHFFIKYDFRYSLTSVKSTYAKWAVGITIITNQYIIRDVIAKFYIL